MTQRFIKIGAAGEQLPADAPAWLAVLDTKTNLTWTVEESERMEQRKCEEYAKGLKVAGFEDWQLPTREQLLTLVDDTRYEPAIDTAFFPNCKSNWYWTRTPAAVSPSDYAWNVDFYNGYAYWGYRGYDGFVRAVRVGQSSEVG